jgi:hypothetical protein
VLEPDEGKLSSPVLRGLSGRKAARLPGELLRRNGCAIWDEELGRSSSDRAVRRKSLAFAADAVCYGFSIVNHSNENR